MTQAPAGDVLKEYMGSAQFVCDFANSEGCPDDPAQWIMFTTKCVCGHKAIRLTCTTCKDRRMMADDSAVWCECCGEVTVPARHAYARVEHI